MFIIHMCNKKVQEKLCTEPKEPDQALEFAIAFEEGIKTQRVYGVQVSAETAKSSVKSEPVFALEKTNPREASDAEKITSPWNMSLFAWLRHCCKFCKSICHVDKCCNKKFPQRHPRE